MARWSGSELAVLVSADNVTFASLGCFTQWSGNFARDKFEVTCGGDENKIYVLGKKDFSVTGTMIFDDTNDAVWDASDASTPQYYRLHPNLTGLPGWYFTGLMYLDASMDVPVNGPITSGVNMSAAGSITRVS